MRSLTDAVSRGKEKPTERSGDWARKRRNSTRQSALQSEFTSTLIFERRTYSQSYSSALSIDPEQQHFDPYSRNGKQRDESSGGAGNLSERQPVIVLKTMAGWTWNTEAITTEFVRENYACSLSSSPTSTLSSSSSSSASRDSPTYTTPASTRALKGKGKEIHPPISISDGRGQSREERTTLEPEAIHIVPTDIYVAQEDWL